MRPSDDSGHTEVGTNPSEQGLAFNALQSATSHSLEIDPASSTHMVKQPQVVAADPYIQAREYAKTRSRIIRFAVLSVLIAAGTIGVFIANHHANPNVVQKTDASQAYPNTTIPMANLSSPDTAQAQVQNNQVLSVNGQLNVNNALVLTPIDQPSDAVAGQLYYNKKTNHLSYYNGVAFQDLLTGTKVNGTIAGATDNVKAGNGLSFANNTLTNNGVLTLQGQSGNISLVSGNGIAISGTTLSNSGVLSVGGKSGNIKIGSGLQVNGDTLSAVSNGISSISGTGSVVVTNDGNGNLTISTSAQPGTGTVTSPNGTSGTIAMFDGVQDIANSIINQSGNTITVGGNLNISSAATVSGNLTVGGSLSLSSALSVTQGGTGASNLPTGSVLIGNGAAPISGVTGTNGQCLVIVSGTPTFTSCPGTGGVTSLNGASGILSIGNASLSGSTITINDATTSSKGIASFNSTNLTVTSGSVNTVQNINTTATPTFGQLMLTSSQAANPMLVINNTDVAASGALLDLQLNGSSKFSVTPNGNITAAGAINGQTVSANANFTGSVTVASTLNVNTISPNSSLTVGATGQSFLLQGNASSSVTATNGINKTTLAFQSPTANVTYNFQTAAAGTYSICTTAGNCVGVGGSVSTSGGTTNKIAKFTGSSTLGDSLISDNGSTVTIGGTLGVNTISPTAALTIGATGQNLTLQGASVSLSTTSGTTTNNFIFATPSGSSKTITLPNASGTVAVSASGPLALDASGNLTCPTCLTSGGSGGTSGVTSVNGLTGTLTLQGSSAGSVNASGSTITINDATSTVKGLASFNSTNLTVTAGNVNTVQDIAVTSTPTFAGLNLTSPLSIGNGGTGATTVANARTNLSAAKSGANSDITSLSGLTTALSVAQGGTGIGTTPTSGQILIGNGSGFSLNTLSAGSGITITNTAGGITISSPGSGTCSGCALTSLSNLAGVAINTSLLPGTAGGANLGSTILPFGQLALSGTSASPAANNFLITGISTGGTRTITLPDASGTVAVSASGPLSLSSTGNLSFTGTLGVSNGGTGATSLTANGVLIGNGTSAISSITGTTGQCLMATSGAPAFGTCPGGGGATASGTTGKIAKFTGSSALGDSLISDNGSTVTVGGGLTIQNGSTSALQVQNSAGTTTFFDVDTTNSQITFGGTAGSGVTVLDNGATAYATLALGNITGSTIGTAASTVDIYTSISINETSSSQTLTIPSPTNATLYGRVVYISNIGTSSFTILGTPIKPGTSAGFIWSNTNGGASWQYSGTDGGNSILNQNTSPQASSNFWISGTGTANTLSAPTYTASNSMAIQVSGTNALSIKTVGAGSIDIGKDNTATIDIGNHSNNARTIGIGNTGGSQTQTVNIGNNGGASSITTIQGGGGVNIYTNSSSAGVTVKAVTDSTTAFRIQNSSAVSILTADTTTSTVTITNLVVTGNITVNGHIITSGTAPTIAAGTAACTLPTVSITGNDTAGAITVTTGTGCSGTGTLALITFNGAFGSAPNVTLTASNSPAANLQIYATSSTTTFGINTNTTPVSATTYTWFYHAMQ